MGRFQTDALRQTTLRSRIPPIEQRALQSVHQCGYDKG
jgi:hypothetical protein